MKKYFISVMTLFLMIFTAVNCFALNPVGADKTGKPELSGKLENGIRVIEITASKYKFDPATIVVKSKEKVRLLARSLDVTHGLAIPELKINSTITPGKTEVIDFVADKEGEFSFYCSVYCGVGHPNMQGKLIILKD